MDYIILDIEFNGRKFASELPMEVIEIGAVRLDENLQFKDEFSSLIKPVYFSKLNSFIKKKTGIPQEDIDTAEGFKAVITRFNDWLKESEDLLLFTWGGEDMKRIVLDNRMHKLDDSFWTSLYYYDLLKGYLRFRNVTNDVSVETALQELEITAEGSAHRALDDARMTGEVLRKIIAHLDMDLKQQYKDMHTNAKERRLVKNAIRSMIQRKAPTEWEVLMEHFLKDKIVLTDEKKVAELQQYFAAEVEKAKQPKASQNV
ncbi:exonuclease domain-containing protein [Paenibacillus sp. 2TAB19]|uniref:exonuclease domain-containing protein n=1 Tax=Paenibacillus sp. 2TAB19 TaxID=3233003 RepID=UPI003F972230